jgi:hypothetical protein
MLKTFLSFGLALSLLSTQEITTLTNADILAMVREKIPATIIVEKIKNSSCAFDTLPSSLVDLKNAGVTDDVLLAMVKAPLTQPCATDRMLTIPAGTSVEIESAFTVLSGNVAEGSAISFQVVHPVNVEGVTVIPAGARATARVTKSKRGSTWGRAGQLAWTMEDTVAVDGSIVPLEFSISRKGHSKGATVATAIAVTSVVFWPAAPFWGFKRGKDARLLAGTRFEVMVRRKIAVKVVDPVCPK